MKEMIFIILALTSSPAPASNFYAATSPEVAAEIQELVISGEYRTHLDFNGDGELNMADVVGVSKRYQDNRKHGNEITLDRAAVEDIAAENYPNPLIYWEIDRINGKLCRQYELTSSEVTEAEIYLEFEDYSDTVLVELNPYKEIVIVKE